MAQGLGDFSGLKGRFELVDLPSGITLIDDTYNANPISLKAALKSAQSLAAGKKRLIIGLGDMLELGEEAEEAHMRAGKWVASLEPKLFVVVGEFAPQMVEGAREAGLGAEAIEVAESAEDMADIIGRALQPQDLILLKASRKIGLDKVRELIVQETEKMKH